MSEPTRTELYEAIVEGDVASAADATQTLIDAGLSADEILDGSVVPAMDEVGRLFDEGEYFVPELLMASKATQIAMGVLDPLMKSAGVEKIGCVVIGTVKGDMHDIGKNLVAAMLEGERKMHSPSLSKKAISEESTNRLITSFASLASIRSITRKQPFKSTISEFITSSIRVILLSQTILE